MNNLNNIINRKKARAGGKIGYRKFYGRFVLVSAFTQAFGRYACSDHILPVDVNISRDYLPIAQTLKTGSSFWVITSRIYQS